MSNLNDLLNSSDPTENFIGAAVKIFQHKADELMEKNPQRRANAELLRGYLSDNIPSLTPRQIGDVGAYMAMFLDADPGDSGPGASFSMADLEHALGDLPTIVGFIHATDEK